MNGKQIFYHYQSLNTNYASIVKMLPHAVYSFELAFEILERCQEEKKKLFASYPGIDPPEVTDQVEAMEPIGPIIDGYLYLVPSRFRATKPKKNEPLRGKTIFDFTSDTKILKEITGFNTDDNSRKTHYIETCDPINKAIDIVLFAKMTNDIELQKAGELQIKNLRRKWDKRCAEAQKKGLIID